ncbi:unnamed protein product [Polarella glacialis]|uniref:Uncharacterized protein n=1 Tax=Polarella glacialis TaxID=89957 RepID=A0A813GGA2_POLGL|nr:unnamed protein product [Polarella glacialis]CAE8688522.1 unnamed protein product [Polarella glacialis]
MVRRQQPATKEPRPRSNWQLRNGCVLASDLFAMTANGVLENGIANVQNQKLENDMNLKPSWRVPHIDVLDGCATPKIECNLIMCCWRYVNSTSQEAECLIAKEA